MLHRSHSFYNVYFLSMKQNTTCHFSNKCKNQPTHMIRTPAGSVNVNQNFVIVSDDIRGKQNSQNCSCAKKQELLLTILYIRLECQFT